MLTDDIPRIDADGSHNDIPLLDGFLNPAAYYNDRGHRDARAPPTGRRCDHHGAVRPGRQRDRRVRRRHPAQQPARPPARPARDQHDPGPREGIPPLNEVRRQIFAQTNDGQLEPYTGWIDFGDQLKHPESLVNFVAAYGTHPTITAATTWPEAARRRAIVDPSPDDPMRRTTSRGTATRPPRATSCSAPATGRVGGKTTTGVDDIDLWVGGLAEHTNLFGGLLGSTFNYVFENQLTDLQNGDRLYYLARTPGMNLRAQLEGNSFSELVMRNTPAHTLKADPFATADCKFELGQPGPRPPPWASGKLITGTVADDPASECDENEQLLRMADGTWRYRTRTRRPSGINAQAVYNGTAGVDRIWGGADNDTFWGGDGQRHHRRW